MVKPIGDNDATLVVPLPHRDKEALWKQAQELKTYMAVIARELIQGYLKGDIALPSEDDNKLKGG